ncbi:hypothetical protein CLV24_101113 [Pontibacter ummariensis]|uniref:Uncharacterized protein n=1 Tax=Pontibacter ummariensis TaxID=1610492 RepID=A0A239B2Z3_9BACT|nr:hypothetical protein [Pontibacter ummariensis]PRY16269.1 hypothetical protein CLV24_101113 [Pontibacter ummariensis]SNS02227.1 hypothetical protein SAMN06296052_101113 [Pontibacter ummariensis]
MEAAALYFRFKDNLATIAGALNSKLEVRSMPYNTSIPLEIDLLADLLRLHGLEFSSTTPGAARLFDFQRWYAQNEEKVNKVMHRVLEDKKAYIKTATGTLLQKEMLYRRLEYFKETAHTLEVMMAQQKLHSPKHFSYPFLKA